MLSLVLQGLGGGIAATSNGTGQKDVGKNVMLAGLGWQVLSMVLFAACCWEVWLRVRGKGSDYKFPDLVRSTRWKRFLGCKTRPFLPPSHVPVNQ